LNFLLDVNVLVAWGWTDHVDHGSTASWIRATRRDGKHRLFTSPIPQLGFVRISVQRTRGAVNVELASRVLDGMLRSLGTAHRFLADDAAADAWPTWCQAAGQTTDAHLVQLARRHGAVLATLDAGIPEAHLIGR
jgi:uncharacterized protein